MSTVDDLLVRRRRGALNEADERRLQIAVQTSPEHELSLLAGAVFDREGVPQVGDALLVRSIVRQVEGEWSGTFQRVVARRRLSRWVSVPLLAAGVAAASFGGYHAFESLQAPAGLAQAPIVARAPEAMPDPEAEPTPQAGPAPFAHPAALPAPEAAALEAAPFEELPAPEVPALAALPDAPALPEPLPQPVAARAAPAVAAKPRVLPEPVPSPAVAAQAPPDVAEPVALRAPAAAGAPEPGESARELFRRANRLRQTDWEAAASLYEQLTLRFADSHEAGVAEMALGKHALAEGRSSEALRWFHAYQHRSGGELASEALWGEAQALENLGERPRAHALWRRLVEQYPASAYAAAAREQLGP